MKIKFEDLYKSKNRLFERQYKDKILAEKTGYDSAKSLAVYFKVKIIDGNTIDLYTKINGEIVLNCDRCLEDFSHKVNASSTQKFSVSELGPEKELDIEEELRQSLILSMPMKVLCKDSCKGLCPMCGKNLNEESCNCVIN